MSETQEAYAAGHDGDTAVWEQAWTEAFQGAADALRRGDDVLIARESFALLLLCCYRFARRAYEAAGVPAGRSAAGLFALLLDDGLVAFDEQDPWPRDTGGRLAEIFVVALPETPEATP